MTDIHARRRDIALAEQAVERHRLDFQRRTAETRSRVASVRRRISDWKVPMILGGGALLGVLFARALLARTDSNPRGQHASHEPVATQTVKAAGKTAGVTTGLLLTARVLPLLMPLVLAYAERRGRLNGSVDAASGHGRSDWWAVVRGIAPLIRR